MIEHVFTEIVPPTVSGTDSLVIETTSAKVRKFLYELAEGTNDYRSLHSLTEQVEHQYHGRFIVELIQNAHDALSLPDSEPDGNGRIEFSIKAEGEFGALYVANDGRPFSPSNFKSLSQLGQSDKDPQDSIGNKGIGFRSVLEITNAPEIYSRSDLDKPIFDGFCFAFSPAVIHRLAAPALALLAGDDAVLSPFGNVPLVDWDTRLLAKFRANVARLASGAHLTADAWLAGEMAFLSPYLLPFPLQNHDRGSTVADFERRGFSTLIRFPLKSAATLALVREKLSEVDDNALLFLEKASSLVLDSGHQRRELSRRQSVRPGSPLKCREVSITDGHDDQFRRYWVWTRDLVLTDAPDAVRSAVHTLPGKWPQLRDAAVSIAVRLGDSPEMGSLSIFLPTLLGTGCATHINAPFFGDMSRTHIDFGTGDDQGLSGGAVYNRFLLAEAAGLAVTVVRDELSGQSVAEARAIVDLLSPWGLDQVATNRWQQLTANAVGVCGADVRTANWFLSDRGWGAMSDTSLLPVADKASVLTHPVLRKNAAFAAYVEGLDSRRVLIEALSEGHGVAAYPSADDLAVTVELVAQEIHKLQETDWNKFWADAGILFDGDCSALVGRRVLLGNDGQLHASGKDCTVFFVPRQGASDDEEVENDSDIKEIPITLRPFVAFLSDQILVYEDKGGRLQQTRIRRLLYESKLVSRFRREDILNDVLIAKTPQLSQHLSGPDAALCQDILAWALRLMGHLVVRGKGEKSLRLLKGLPAPCNGGWYPVSETAFGPGWTGTQGAETQNYLSRIETPEVRAARDRLLLPPNHHCWGGNGGVHLELLRLVGVFDGLRLMLVDSQSWTCRFEAYMNNFLLPTAAPPGCSRVDWEEYRMVASQQARPVYNRGKYEIQGLYAFPGLDKYLEFDFDTRFALMEVVLGSASHWHDGWDACTISRYEGNSNMFSLPSPVAFNLRKLPWLGLREGEDIQWCRPADRWHVPALELARGRKWQFAHLRPLPGELANRLDVQPSLSAAMRRLGTPRFDPETKTSSTQLLDALVDAVERSDVPHWDVFLGQVRSAWRGFEPAVPTSFPKKLLVQRGSSRLKAEQPDKDHPIYLPDSTKSFLSALKHFELPVVAIETEDAKRLAERFTTAFPNSVLRASTLEPVPLVNGERWIPTSNDRLRDAAEFEWAIPVVLTIAAFHGPQAQGTATRAFRKHVETFRDARLSMVARIATGLFRGETSIAPPLPMPALWQGDSQTLLVSESSKANMALLSEAFAGVLDRDDLEVPIKLVLGITGAQPEHADIVRAMEQLKLTEAHYQDVREHWRGDVSQIIERLIPLLAILRPDADIGDLAELDTDDAVVAFLERLTDERINGGGLVQIARDSADMFDFGCKAFGIFGDTVQLSKWNAALSLRGEPPLINSEAADMFRMHLATVTPVLMCLIASLICRHPEVGDFRGMSRQVEDLICPEEFRTGLWEVHCAHVISRVIALFVDWRAAADELDALREADTPQALKHLLASTGLETDFDPIQAARDNRERLRQTLTRLQQIGLAWALENSYANPSDWESRVDTYLDKLSAGIDATAFTHIWSENELWTMVQRLTVDQPSVPFWSAVAIAKDTEDLVVALGLTNEALVNANSKLEALRESARRRNRVVEVCGKEFENTDENLAGLWSHICAALPPERLSQLSSIDLKEPVSLADVTKREKRYRVPREPVNRPPPKRLTKSMENLIGLSGEIHAFRMLQNQYGTSAVSPAAWVSGNSALVFQDNKTDDGRGCDFVIVFQDRTHYIEVKSSEGDQESFSFGSSEIRLAMELSKKSRKKRKETFLVLRVSNALTMTPSFELLPNPYDPKYQHQFVIEDADARVRYLSVGKGDLSLKAKALAQSINAQSSHRRTASGHDPNMEAVYAKGDCGKQLSGNSGQAKYVDPSEQL